MAKRSKELFELLAERGNAGAADREAESARDGGRPKRESKKAGKKPVKKAPKGSKQTSQKGESRTKRRTRDDEPARKPRTAALRAWLASRGGDEANADAPLGKRRVNVSLNLLLFFVAAFVLTNIMSYMVGSMRRGGVAENYGPLSVRLDHYWTIQVTRPLPRTEWQYAWDIQEILKREGYRDADVSRFRIDGAEWYRAIVGRGQSRASLEPLKRQLDVTLQKLSDMGSITADPRLETALVRQQEERAWRTE